MANLKEAQGDLEQLSGLETFKSRSGGLYGPIQQDLASAEDHFSDESTQLLKHHGTYQQDNRDTRKARKKQGLGKEYTMMVRTKFPGGKLTADQYLFCDDLAGKYGQNDIRATSRQGFQFHGVVKGDLRPLLHDLNTQAQITTLGGCGDVVRNTMASPVADIDERYRDYAADLTAIAREISNRTLPKSMAYYDLWVDGEKVQVNEDGTVQYGERSEEQPDELYGKQYLPRKFKIGLATDFDNSVDIYTQDLGFIAVTKEGRIEGFEVLAGGGLGYSHTMERTYPRLGTPVAFISQEQIMPMVEAMVKVQRDYGERTDRKQARLKYTIDRMGVDAFIEALREYAGFDFAPPRNIAPNDQPDYLGWHKQHQDGLHFVGVWIENGRIKDFDGGYKFRSGLRAVIERFKPDVRVTPHHNIIFANIAEADIPAVQAMLDEYNLPTDKGISPLRRTEMACPALPLCPLALSEAERWMPEFMRALEAAGHAEDGVCIRVTGCPNGCARSVTSEIGLIGKGPKRYVLRTGGDVNGTRLNEILVDVLKEPDVVPTISRLLELWKAERQDGERFGAWSHRLGVEKLQEMLGAEAPTK